MILVVYSHPYPSRSRASRRLAEAVRDLPGLAMHSLYDRYPDFDIDIAAEQAAIAQAKLIVWLHPIYWYSPPGLFKLWLDKVFAYGWAYGPNGVMLRGKHCLWVPTTGGEVETYSAAGIHEQPFHHFAAPLAETARFCGMHWQPPMPLHGAHSLSDAALDEAAQQLRTHLIAFSAANQTPPRAPTLAAAPTPMPPPTPQGATR